MVRESGGSPSSFLLYCCCKETQTRTEEDDGQKTSSYTMSEYEAWALADLHINYLLFGIVLVLVWIFQAVCVKSAAVQQNM